eukprot:1265732-Prymnesium_polylepis.1
MLHLAIIIFCARKTCARHATGEGGGVEGEGEEAGISMRVEASGFRFRVIEARVRVQVSVGARVEVS